ncbi:hypothetical protein FQN54_002965 [Arachnomyces sp. PD_36]|nr:hypothetical protein FQN54_002965 [Arachnomyces sp. PD_36]
MNFLDFPPEIRLQIYTLLLDPNQYKSGYKQITQLMKESHDSCTNTNRVPHVTFPRLYVTRYTPSILLLNRQIATEALPVLYNAELTLTGTPGAYFVMRQMDIAEFICETLLQRIRYVVLRLAYPEKFFVLTLLDIWGRGNELQRVVVYVPPERKNGDGNWGVVESRLKTFTHAEGIHFEMRIVDNPLRNGE